MHGLAHMANRKREVRQGSVAVVHRFCRRVGAAAPHGFHRKSQSGDSSRLAAEATRLASALPTSGAERFVGLPFTVTSLWRFRAGPGVEGVVANLVRHVNEEARPLEERTLVIAERDSTRRDERFTLSYYDRSQGAEETVVSRDVLAIARATPDAQPMLVIGRDYGDGMAYAIVQRDPSGRWREKWRSPRRHCS